MAIDLTGISNVNEFYTDHYLATYFELSVTETVRRWRLEAEAMEVQTPNQGLRDAGKVFGRLYGRSASGRRGAVKDDTAEMIETYLASLGYPDGAQEHIPLPSGTMVPLFREFLDGDGRPRVWVLAALPSGEEDIFSTHPADLSDTEVPMASEITVEEAVDELMLDVSLPARFVILASPTELALVDREKWAEKRYLSFDMEEIFRRREESTFQAVATLLAKSSLCPTEGETLIDELDRQAREHASEVSDSLRYALRECVELLGNEVIYDWVGNKGHNLETEPIDASELTIECLRYMYRMLFLLFMEARPELGFAPTKAESYQRSYSLESVREIAESYREGIDASTGDTNFIDRTLRLTCELVYDGYPTNDLQFQELSKQDSIRDVFVVPPLKAHIFDRQRTPLIDGAKLRDSVMLQIVDRMSYTRPARGKAERVSYGTLGINQLGSVYEALLSYRGFIATERLYEVKRARDSFDPLDVGYFVTEDELGLYSEDERVRHESGPQRGQLRTYEKGHFIYRLAGREREQSASYYTPEALTQCLVKYALKELLEGKSADEILRLTVCEPAMGSAAFLNEVINQLAEAYLNRKQEELGESIPHDRRQLELQRVKMLIADRNVYGIDLNPIAVELGEVSLWLNTISQDGYVPWFGNQLHCGNSLIGARRQGYTERDLSSRTRGIRWYDHEPERVSFKTGCSKSHRVYHFLVGDPGMSKYDDRVIRGLEPQQLEAIKRWNRAFIAPYGTAEVQSLRELSYEVDRLWTEQVKQQRLLRQNTTDRLECYGFEDTEGASHTNIRQKDQLLSLFYRSEHARNAGPYARLKFAMDYWCSLWFWPIEKADLLPTRDEFLMHMSFILVGTTERVAGVKNQPTLQLSFDFDEGNQTPEQLEFSQMQDEFGSDKVVDLDDLCEKFPTLELARQIAEQQHFFHWELEFADVFEARGGFDLVLGNPPWVKLEFKSVDALSDINPMIAVKNLTRVEASRMQSDILEQPEAKTAYIKAYEDIAGAQSFYSAQQNYPLLKGTSTNLYKCFIPQALLACNQNAIFAFVQPTGVFDEANAREMRKVLYRKLKRYYRFENELKLFRDVGHAKKFCVAIYGSSDTPSFECINSLFVPATIDACYQESGDFDIPGLKDENGWCTKGHPQRVISVSDTDLKMFATAFGDKEDWQGTALPVIHAVPIMNTLKAFSLSKSCLANSSYPSFGTTLWPETGAQENGTIKKHEHFPEDCYSYIVTGPVIGLGNPVYQAAKEECNTHHAYDLVDIERIPDHYIQRVKYEPSCTREDYYRSAPNLWDSTSYLDRYKILTRRRLNQSGSRTLVSALYPPQTGHVHTVLGTECSSDSLLLALLGEMCSLVFDGFIKITGKSDVYFDTVELFPLPRQEYISPIVHRALLLNCLTEHYSSIWADCWDEGFVRDSFSKTDVRLDNSFFLESSPSWGCGSPCRIEYQRRQLLVELDVLTAMSLGLTRSDLENLYNLQFPVLKQYEEDTWYDAFGRVVFTNNKGLPGVGLSRQEFDRVRSITAGAIQKSVIDYALPGGPVQRTIEYVPPFDRCDRIEDYRTAWKFFENKYGAKEISE
jgi:hypothetical protein